MKHSGLRRVEKHRSNSFVPQAVGTGEGGGDICKACCVLKHRVSGDLCGTLYRMKGLSVNDELEGTRKWQ